MHTYAGTDWQVEGSGRTAAAATVIPPREGFKPDRKSAAVSLEVTVVLLQDGILRRGRCETGVFRGGEETTLDNLVQKPGGIHRPDSS